MVVAIFTLNDNGEVGGYGDDSRADGNNGSDIVELMATLVVLGGGIQKHEPLILI